MKLNICIMFGGVSSEHSISCLSAYNVIKNISKEKYDITVIGIDLKGDFLRYIGDIENIKNNIWREDVENLIKIDSLALELKKYDSIFPVLHGKYSEDGAIQGLFEMFKVKYVGAKIEGSSIGYNKIISKILVKSLGIDIVKYATFSKYEILNTENILLKLIEANLKYPLFVKPNKEGSSYGVSKVLNIGELKEAIREAFTFDDNVLVEEFIGEKKEVECAVLGNSSLIISEPGEIVSSSEIYDFDDKYVNNTSSIKIPADIGSYNINLIKQYSKEIFKCLNLCSLARIDFFVTDDRIYFNEVNTMPGFTDISMYPKMMEHIGISYSELIDRLIECSLNS